MSKILKNTTGSAISLSVLGLPDIPASGQLGVEVFDYTLLASDDSISYLTPLINSGDIIVNSPVAGDLDAEDGLDFIRYPDRADAISVDDSTLVFDAEDVQEALQRVDDITSPLRVPVPLIYNGTLSNGNFIGYSNLLPGSNTPIISPINGFFVEFTWSNNNSSADFALEFRKNTTTGTPFFTWSVDNTKSDAVTLPVQEPFTLGDEIYIKYVDQGTNARDAAIVLLFKSA